MPKYYKSLAYEFLDCIAKYKYVNALSDDRKDYVFAKLESYDIPAEHVETVVAVIDRFLPESYNDRTFKKIVTTAIADVWRDISAGCVV